MNLYEMFLANGRQPGFWVKLSPVMSHYGRGLIYRIVAVDPFMGPPPGYGYPEVRADSYCETTGKIRQMDVVIGFPHLDAEKVEPEWQGSIRLRSLANLEIPYEALVRQEEANLAEAEMEKDRSRASKSSRPSRIPERIVILNVPYERKEEAKAIKAQWLSHAECWWLPADNESALQTALELGMTYDGPDGLRPVNLSMRWADGLPSFGQ